MLLTAISLMTVGALSALLGTKLFKLLLPVVGLVVGSIIGFSGFQGIFGSGTVSTTVAVFVAIAVGLMLAILSYVFFDIAVVVLYGLVISYLFSFLGIALGLSSEGFVVFLLSVSGFIVGLMYAMAQPMSVSLVVSLTSLLGVALILAGVFLVVGKVSLDGLHEDGVVKTFLAVVDQSFLWVFVWLGGSIAAMQLQAKVLAATALLDSNFEFDEPRK